tara:strand:- start:2492 stop:2800 length:309 start_codon:yes stop_codon:yes gene_type:complete
MQRQLKNWYASRIRGRWMPYNKRVNRRGSMRMTDEEQLNLVENHLEDIFALCGSYAESGTEEDLANIRAVYAEYEEWLDTYVGLPDSDEDFTVAWAPNLTHS